MKPPVRPAFRRWAPVLVWAACIFGFSTGAFSGEHTGGLIVPLLRMLFPGAPLDTLEVVHGAIRKAAHVTEYAILSHLVYPALRDGGTAPGRARVEAVLFATAYAATDEFHQLFVPSRTPALHDVLFDASGALLGQVVGAWRSRRRRAARAAA